MTPGLSSRLLLGLVLLAAGLIVVGAASTILLVRVERGSAIRDEDVARRLLRNSALPFAIQIVVRAIDFAFVMVFFRLLSPDAAGDYAFAALFVSLYLGTISEWGLGVLLTREVARDRTAIRGSFGTALLLRLGLSAAALPIAVLVIGSYRGLQSLGVIADAISGRGAGVIVVLALTLLPGAIGGAVTSVFLATERPVVPALANLLNNVVSTALRLAALLLGFGVVGVAWAALLATVLNAAVFSWLLRRDFGWPGWEWDGALARMMLRAAFPLMLNSLLVGVFFRFDYFIIKAYHDSSVVATYDAAYKVAPLALILPPIIVNALFPRFSRQAIDDRQGLLRGYRLTLRVLLLAALPLAMLVSVFAAPVVGLIAGQQYAERGGSVLALLVWFVPFSYVNGITQYVLIALDQPGSITRAFALTAAFNLAGNMLLVPVWGLTAAAAMTVASELVLYLPFRRVLRTELGETPLWSLLWRPGLGILPAAAVMLVSRRFVPGAIVGGMLLYAAALWSLHTFTAEDRLLVERLLGRAKPRF